MNTEHYLPPETDTDSTEEDIPVSLIYRYWYAFSRCFLILLLLTFVALMTKPQEMVYKTLMGYVVYCLAAGLAGIFIPHQYKKTTVCVGLIIPLLLMWLIVSITGP